MSHRLILKVWVAVSSRLKDGGWIFSPLWEVWSLGVLKRVDFYLPFEHPSGSLGKRD